MANKGKEDRPSFVSLLFKLLKFKPVAKIAAKIFGSLTKECGILWRLRRGMRCMLSW